GFPVAKPNALFTCDSYLPPGGDQTSTQWFNNSISCYKDRPSYTLRNTEDRFAWIRNPAVPALNLTVARSFQMSERLKLQLRGETFNAMNTPLFGSPTTDFKDPRFGQLPLSQRNFPRLIQIAAKILF
ncbi:MAG: hypothetical protein M3Z23_02915, partial [Acidobacteriota bacterium]|nr:hypothetical protein [Acidobacteriota bacterium]